MDNVDGRLRCSTSDSESPSHREVAPRSTWEIAVFKNVFGIILDISGVDTEQKTSDNDSFTFEGIQGWMEDHYGVKVSKSSISMVKDKCNASVIGFKAGEGGEETLNEWCAHEDVMLEYK